MEPVQSRKSSTKWSLGWLGLICTATAAVLLGLTKTPPAADTYVVVAYNELGMHCMQNDFSQMMILPPFNTLHAQVLKRGMGPDIMTGDITVTFELPSNTSSSSKTNFWSFVKPLMGLDLPPDIGLGGFGLSGTMAFDAARRDWGATGIPLTPIDDDGKENPYPLALVTVKNDQGTVVAQTQAVVPVSWEMSCNLCHNKAGESVATNILSAHDRLHGTNLIAHQPVMCAQCHSDNALGAAGQPGVSSLSAAMHGAHANRMDAIDLANKCYACHPGVRTNCLRDVHAASAITCTDCHGSMAQVADTRRNPWVQEPRCDQCHHRAGFEFEQPNTLFRNAKGHGGTQCMTCHGSPHAVGPAVTATDNAQALRLQGHTGPINTCTVCHTSMPTEAFFHKVDN